MSCGLTQTTAETRTGTLIVGKLASQIAGYKLSWIISVLLLPFLVVCYMTTSSIRSDLAEIDQSAAELEVQLATASLLFNHQNGVPDRAIFSDLLSQAAKVVRDADAQNELLALRDRAMRGDAATEQFTKDLFKTVAKISQSQSVAGRVGAEAVFLSVIANQHIPDALLRMSELDFAVKAALKADKPNLALERRVRAALSEWKAATQSVQREVESTRRIAASPSSYQPFQAMALELGEPLQELAQVIESASPAGLQPALDQRTAMPASMADTTKRLKDLWTYATRTLTDKLDSRNQQLIWRLKLVLAGALGVSLTGIGSAIYLFRSSFKRLDELEASRVKAEAAQEESDNMNRRLTQINNEIVHLNHELADKMRRLKDAQDELLKRGRLEQLGQLTATVAHELRNPLGAVRTSAFLLERKVKDKGLGVDPQLQRINNGISRCDSIITQLLDFSRTKQISAQPMNLDEWLAGIIEEEAKRLPAAVDIECTLGLENADVPFDPARLQRAIINLVSNASEAMVGTGEDPSKFTVKAPRIKISTRRVDDMAVITVQDNGPGISSEILEKIREPLFTTKSFGTGLGIPAVEQIATQHGGRLDIASTPGNGAVFSVFLPFKVQEEEAEAA
jgi:signal transduction histidine kinase